MASLAINQSTPHKAERSSNLELFRIVCMLAIVAHHYLVNSGLMWTEGTPIEENPRSINTIFLLLFGMWGKTGINCFMMITGYFMCKSKITIQKFLKLLLEVYFYKIIIYLIFLVAGREELSPLKLLQIVLPIWDLNTNFVSCFLVFFLTIPFWNILVNKIDKRQHLLLLALLLCCFTVFGSIPHFHISLNYVFWFGIIFLIASYFRLYPSKWTENRKMWGWLSVVSIIMAMVSVAGMQLLFANSPFFFVADSHRILAVLVSVCTFNWFRLLPIGQSKAINWIASSTFAVLLIHGGSDAMRDWIWRDIFDCVGHYSDSLPYLLLYCTAATIIVFFACILIDKARLAYVESPFSLQNRILKKITEVQKRREISNG